MNPEQRPRRSAASCRCEATRGSGGALASLFRGDAVTIEAEARLVDDQLFPEEWAHIQGAIPKRRAEFGTARVCAREALAALGLPPTALVPTGDRAPVWPAGVVGSITHTHGYCAVVVDRSPPMRSIGLDAELLRPLEEGTIELICTPAERAWIRAQPDASEVDLVLLVFSAKEAYYKCQYPLSSTVLDFHDVELRINPTLRRFEARAVRVGLPEPVTRLEGRYAFDRGMVFCGVELSASA